jgi:integrase
MLEAIGKKTPVLAITANTVRAYHEVLSKSIAEGKRGRNHANSLWAAFRRFVRWCWSEHLLENEPRNLKTLRFVKDAPTPIAFTVEEVRTVLEHSEGEGRLFCLLALNCGFYGVDTGSLKQDEVDWEAGTISRKRTKTGRKKSTPLVTYALWPETFELLKKYRSQDKVFSLTDGKGKPLYRLGEYGRYDLVSRELKRIVAAAGISKPQSKLRHTSSTMVASHPTYGRFAQYFLGHAAETMADRHYVVPSQEQFNEALGWLRGQILGDD